MSITLINRCLFTTDAQIIAHGVNARGKFASGIAGEIARRYPRVRDAYLFKHARSGWRLGDTQFVAAFHDSVFPLIANVCTQVDYGYNGQLYVDYDAIKTGVTEVVKYAAGFDGWSVAMPKLGAGLGGADWGKVESIIRDISFQYSQVEIFIYYL